MVIQTKLQFVLKNNTFQKQRHEERPLALASQVSTHIRNHKRFMSVTCHVHAHKEMSHYITRDETIRISEHCRQYIHTAFPQVMPQRT